ncbi:mechanosensitive ion channel family protein [Marivita geojedonensis]|uniref:mechanosensitive ion channel family protein n=1 Tax=Marivita geojedonensis TaxID=1123756 RepID=UPI000D430903|nr:mechanosensitive ion channel family protein [Marivita geojedonensis]PRY81506.1 small conductance mechanosensitive channel [Marivita geojedonensis]
MTSIQSNVVTRGSWVLACMLGLFATCVLLLSTVAVPAQETLSEGDASRTTGANSEQVVDDNAANSEPGLSRDILDPNIPLNELELRLIPLTKSELESLAETWLETVRAATEEVMAAQITILRTDQGVEDAARQNLSALVLERKALFDKYSRVISSLEKKGGDPSLVAEYRAYRSSVIIDETRNTDFETLVSETLSWLMDREGGISVGLNGAVLAVALLGLLLFARVSRRTSQRMMGRVPNLSKLLQAFLATVVYWLVLAFGLLVVLSAMGIDITPVFALIGGASFILAFAFQDTLGNLASGLMIMINRPFDEGDYVDVGGVAGTVRSVSIVATKVVTPDNQVIVIPNKNVWGNVITNVTASTTRRVDLLFGISYADSISDALDVIKETVTAHPLVLADPEPVIRVHELADNSVNFICRPWSKTADYWTVYWDLTQQIKEKFDEAGISIPYPQRDVHIHHHGTDASRADSS